MKLQIITPEKILVEGEASVVQVPGTEGDFGVLPGHAPFVSTIRPGVITVELAGGGKEEVPVESGLAEVTPEKCLLLVELAA